MKWDDFLFLERTQVIEALFTFVTSSPQEESQRRSNAIKTLISLYSLSDAHKFYRGKPSKTRIPDQDKTPGSKTEATRISESLLIECQLTQCVFCLGREDYPSESRQHAFHSRCDLKRHFHRYHLQHYEEGESILCPHPRCRVYLTTSMQIRNYAESV